MSVPGLGHPAEVIVLEDPPALASMAVDRFLLAARQGIEARGAAHVAMTGGSTAAALYKEIRAPGRRDALDWEQLHLWWGDERYVPLDHPESNAGLALRLLFEPGLLEVLERDEALPIPAANVHPFPVDEAIGEGRGADWAASRYADLLRTTVPTSDGEVPILDLVLLGIGPDGHILSVFPGSPALAAGTPLAMAIAAPRHIGPHLDRLTLNPAVLDAARRVLVMVSGEAKATIVHDILRGTSGDRWPAQRALRAHATWLLDRGAAGQ